MNETLKANILLVDDQPAKLLSYEAMLGSLGENLLTASSAREALEHLLHNDVAVVLVDVCMPELDGFELAAMMREHPRFQKTPIIFVSGVHLSDLDRLKGYAVGAVDYVPVPVVPEILRAKVSIFADLYRKTQELESLNRDLEAGVAERTAELQASTQELREREHALREADRRKDEFLAVLAHEIRNPLAPIRTAVQLMRMKALPEKQRADAQDIIERQVEHLVRLIDDLLDVSRITSGLIRLQRERLSMAEIVARAVETSRPLIDAKSQDLIVVVPDQPPLVNGDLTRLSQVIANLLNNSSKYTENGGQISLRVEEDGDDVVIRVKDSGIGIAEEDLSKVFVIFTQVERSRTAAPGGLGIGLALVRRLVELHDGSVSAHSAGVGQGAEMCVRLPRAIGDRPAATPPARRDPDVAKLRATAGAKRVLVVDDNRDAADSIASLVELVGYHVRTAYDGDQALNLASVFAPDVLMLDLGMPGLGGCETARRIRQQPWGQAMTLIALTGWGQEQDRRRTAEAGFNAHLVKPVGVTELLSALDACAPKADSSAP